jgi:hypothetical protein
MLVVLYGVQIRSVGRSLVRGLRCWMGPLWPEGPLIMAEDVWGRVGKGVPPPEWG